MKEVRWQRGGERVREGRGPLWSLCCTDISLFEAGKSIYSSFPLLSP